MLYVSETKTVMYGVRFKETTFPAKDSLLGYKYIYNNLFD